MKLYLIIFLLLLVGSYSLSLKRSVGHQLDLSRPFYLEDQQGKRLQYSGFGEHNRVKVKVTEGTGTVFSVDEYGNLNLGRGILIGNLQQIMDDGSTNSVFVSKFKDPFKVYLYTKDNIHYQIVVQATMDGRDLNFVGGIKYGQPFLAAKGGPDDSFTLIPKNI